MKNALTVTDFPLSTTEVMLRSYAESLLIHVALMVKIDLTFYFAVIKKR